MHGLVDGASGPHRGSRTVTATAAEHELRPGSSNEIEAEDAMGDRLCVGCRRSSPQGELLRFAIAPEAPWLVPDPRRRLGGRGVSVHPTRACVQSAVKRGGFARALRRSVPLDAEDLCRTAAVLYARRVESLLSAARRRGLLLLGTEAVRAAMRDGRLELLVVAQDAENRREDLAAVATRLEKRCVVFGTKRSLGHLFGRDEVGVLGVLDPRIGDEIVRCAAHEAGLMGRMSNTDLLLEAE
jgi:predicted RNA-binding protein YlxR (DUF448 family)/ribosomal protein L30E